jgi:hypothetical protein
MKQFVTKDQVKELTPKARKQLVDWWYSKGYQYHPFDAEGQEIEDPLMAIGQMIEYLDENGKTEISSTEYSHEYYTNKNHSVRVEVDWGDEKELCDNLWECVKESLEENP